MIQNGNNIYKEETVKNFKNLQLLDLDYFIYFTFNFDRSDK